MYTVSFEELSWVYDLTSASRGLRTERQKNTLCTALLNAFRELASLKVL